MIGVEDGPEVGSRECANDLSESAADGGPDAILNSEKSLARQRLFAARTSSAVGGIVTAPRPVTSRASHRLLFAGGVMPVHCDEEHRDLAKGPARMPSATRSIGMLAVAAGPALVARDSGSTRAVGRGVSAQPFPDLSSTVTARDSSPHGGVIHPPEAGPQVVEWMRPGRSLWTTAWTQS
jgi:hypothetical protein